jgi:hypothetical protein
MDDNRLILYLKFPLRYMFGTILIFLFSIYCLVFTDDTILRYVLCNIFVLLISIYITIIIIGANIFKKIGFKINKEEILFFNLYGKKMFLWKELISYNITGDEKRGNLFLNFYTEESLKNKNILKNKYVLRISSKLYKIKIEELINRINEIKCSNVA